MSKKDSGGEAFPLASAGGGTLNKGMYLRDYFAAKAINGMLSDWGSSKNIITAHGGGEAKFCEGVAAMAYGIADAMIAERAK